MSGFCGLLFRINHEFEFVTGVDEGFERLDDFVFRNGIDSSLILSVVVVTVFSVDFKHIVPVAVGDVLLGNVLLDVLFISVCRSS